MDCHHARNERRCHWPAAHGIDALTKSSSAPARPKRRRARRRDERYHYQHELADVRQRPRAKDHIHSIPTRPPSGAVRGHFVLAKQVCVARRWSYFRSCIAGANDWMERRSVSRAAAWQFAAGPALPRPSRLVRPRRGGAIRRAPRSGRDKVQSDSTLAVVRSAFPSRRFLTSKKAERPILKGFLD